MSMSQMNISMKHKRNHGIKILNQYKSINTIDVSKSQVDIKFEHASNILNVQSRNGENLREKKKENRVGFWVSEEAEGKQSRFREVEVAERLKRKIKSGSEVHVASDSPKASSVDEQVRTEANDAAASDFQDLTIEGKIETAPADDLVMSDFTLSERISCDTKSAPVDEVYNSVLETTPVGDSVKPEMSVSGEVICVTDSAPLGNSVADFVSDTNTAVKG
ncbi:hypothetical protein AAG906_017167 [Vitis piasezkii]